ncbi:MAG: amino acid ABC transporter substrate-binding protein [Lachnospiraceae bacterium]|nr:amino acid ABC transporter substrate-binding protein [Lachnospiraceae bacterium]
MKKIISLVLSLLLVFTFACGTNTAKTENVAETSAESNSPKTLVMCTNAEFEPYEYYEGTQIKGIDIDIINTIGKMKGFNVEIMDIAFDATIPAVINGKADFAMSGMTVTEDRLQNVDFTHPYQTAIQSVIVPKDGAIKSIADMKGKQIGVVEGYTGDMFATVEFGNEFIVRYPKTTDGFQALVSNRIDCYVMDDQVAKALVAGNDNFVILDSAYAIEEYAIAVKKGNSEVLNMLNSAIDEMKASGELQKIIKKYID